MTQVDVAEWREAVEHAGRDLRQLVVLHQQRRQLVEIGEQAASEEADVVVVKSQTEQAVDAVECLGVEECQLIAVQTQRLHAKAPSRPS